MASWDLQAKTESPSLADTFASLLNDVDASFGSIQMKKGDSMRPGFDDPARLPSTGLSDVRELFEPAVASLRRAAEKLELPELSRALDDYHAALEGAGRAPEGVLQGDAKNLL